MSSNDNFEKLGVDAVRSGLERGEYGVPNNPLCEQAKAFVARVDSSIRDEREKRIIAIAAEANVIAREQAASAAKAAAAASEQADAAREQARWAKWSAIIATVAAIVATIAALAAIKG